MLEDNRAKTSIDLLDYKNILIFQSFFFADDNDKNPDLKNPTSNLF